MNYQFCVAVDESLKTEFSGCQLRGYIEERGINIFYYSSFQQVQHNPCHPLLIICNGRCDCLKKEDQWLFAIGVSSPVEDDRIFCLDQIEGDAPRKLFRIILKQYLATSVSQIKENAYDLSLALCMRAGQFFRQLLDYFSNQEKSKSLDIFLEFSVDFLAAHERFYSSSDEEELMEIFNDFIKPHHVIKDLVLVNGDQSDSFITLSQRGYSFLPLFFDEGGDYLAYLADSRVDPDIISFYLFSLLDVLSRFVHSMDQYRSALARNNLWEEVFALVSMPVSFISDKGELLLHNQEFLKLQILPGQCLALLDGGEFEKDQILYKVHRKKIERGESSSYLYSFSSLETSAVKRGKNISSEQLGIISSSIAHELNNPIGGILAALSLLELEDWWDDDSLASLSEMKKSAERCKNLVQIFLGFSRTSRNLGPSNVRHFDSAFEQALNLVRFRMIESNSYFNIERLDTGENYLKEFTTSAVSMVFYLILSEVLTTFSHHKLIAGKDHSSICARLAQYDDRVEMEFNEGLNLAERINQSKLMAQLLDMEGLSLYADGNRIIFQ